MHINTTNNISAQNLAGALQSSKRENPAKKVKNDAMLATVKMKYARIIEQAKKGGSVDPELVNEAKKMLASGALDTLEGARRAAEKLLKYGI